MIQRMSLAQLSPHGVLAAAPRVEGKERMGRGGQRRRQLWEREEDGEKKERREKKTVGKDGRMDGQTDSTDRQALKFPSKPPTQHPRAQPVTLELSSEMRRRASEG